MRSIVFDTGPIITLATNDLLFVLPELKKKFNGDFFIADSVRMELVDRPHESRMFKLESIMVDKLISDGIIKVHEKLNVESLLSDVNKIYSVNGTPLHILDRAEIEALSLALKLQAEVYVLDERTLRMLIEDPKALRKILERKLHRDVDFNKKLADEFLNIVRGIKVVRSSELMVVAYELGLLNHFINARHDSADFLDALLWGLRLRGCGISTQEIDRIIEFEGKNK
ncbi:MAG TPA: hypothetical protein VJI68_00750 [Candidatus Nanoarchaeia archaeon]|nr:hypothetical protein [Candidatus Nanoarchaeia archaeon]